MIIETQKQTWPNFFNGLQARPLTVSPNLGTGYAVIGFWNAITKIFSDTQHQRY
ncbi:MAG: hypothetical protein ACTS73_06325 [Arsenophonus sp. NEOnobi-MAG3]